MLLRTILLVLHIISAGFWISQFPVELIFRRLQKRAEGTPAELTLMTTSMQLLGGLGQYGGMGILITGLGLVILEGLGFLGIGGATPTWLVIKQVIYLILLAMVFTLIRQGSERIGAALEQAKTAGGVVTPEIREQSARFGRIALAHNLLVLANIILAVWRPV